MGIFELFNFPIGKESIYICRPNIKIEKKTIYDLNKDRDMPIALVSLSLKQRLQLTHKSLSMLDL